MLFAPGVEELVLRERAGSNEHFRMTMSEARELAAVLEREGVLGAARLPGLRGDRGRGVRTLEVLVDQRGKNFSFGGDVVAFSGLLDVLPAMIKRWTASLHMAIARLARLDAPIVAAVQGVCAGGMNGLVASADYVDVAAQL